MYICLKSRTSECQQGSKRAPDMNECDILKMAQAAGMASHFPHDMEMAYPLLTLARTTYHDLAKMRVHHRSPAASSHIIRNTRIVGVVAPA